MLILSKNIKLYNNNNQTCYHNYYSRSQDQDLGIKDPHWYQDSNNQTKNVMAKWSSTDILLKHKECSFVFNILLTFQYDILEPWFWAQ